MGNQRRMTPGPLFSRRKSPNPPTENRLISLSLMPIQTSHANQQSMNQFFGANSRRSEMCASDSACAGEPWHGAVEPLGPWAYPRLCGGTWIGCANSGTRSGLSPPVRYPMHTSLSVLNLG